MRKPIVPYTNKTEKQTVYFFKSFFLSLAFVICVSLIPLCMVYKQVCMTQTSLKQEELTDSLSQLNRRVADLILEAERLSKPERIERIARQKCNLEYPLSENIMVLRASMPQEQKQESQFWAIVRKSFYSRKG